MSEFERENVPAQVAVFEDPEKTPHDPAYNTTVDGRDKTMPNCEVRVMLPYHLRNLAKVEDEITLSVAEPVSVRTVLDALEACYPTLCGTIRDHGTLQRRPFLRFFACEEDLTLQSPDEPLPDAVAKGEEPLLIIGAIAGGMA